MASDKKPWGLFERFGIELEYMICDKKTLAVLPVADQLIHALAGSYCNEVADGPISYSNELALHVIELKTTEPIADLASIDTYFQSHIQKLNHILDEFHAVLLPTGMHPWMNPFKELRLWTHGQNAIYEAYNRIFDCRGHGWANLQSVHLNLSFSSDEELKALHAAIRWLLPIMPALSASSPVADGDLTGFLDTRLETYRHNQRIIPSICGKVIPEPVASTDEYHEKILRPMWKDIAPHDPESILQEEWLNSRGAIVRFDRSAIEIRVLDTQECPAMDCAILQAIVAVLKVLASKVQSGEVDHTRISTDDLSTLFLRTVRDGEAAFIDHPDYLSLFGIARPLKAGELWAHLLHPTVGHSSPVLIPISSDPSDASKPRAAIVERLELSRSRGDRSLWELALGQGSSPLALQRFLVSSGPLARRIQRRWLAASRIEERREIYRTLSDCLARGAVFQG